MRVSTALRPPKRARVRDHGLDVLSDRRALLAVALIAIRKYFELWDAELRIEARNRRAFLQSEIVNYNKRERSHPDASEMFALGRALADVVGAA